MAITKYSVDDYEEMIRLGVLTGRLDISASASLIGRRF